MNRTIVIMVVVLVALGLLAMKGLDWTILDVKGDPATPEGYTKRLIEHELSVYFHPNPSYEQDANEVYIGGFVLNGGDRELEDIVVDVQYSESRVGERSYKKVSLGRFKQMEQRRVEQYLTEMFPSDSEGRKGIWYEVQVDTVVFAQED